MSTENFTSRLGKAPAFPGTPFYEGDPVKEMADAFSRDLLLHKSHVAMLSEQGIISHKIGQSIMAGLLDLERLGPDGMTIDPSLGLYLSEEKYLVDKLGSDVAGRMHTARSQNDLEHGSLRLMVRGAIEEIIAELFNLQEAMLEQSGNHVETVMPGYTHNSQQAQPITLAHYLLASYDAFSRDIKRLEQAYAEVTPSPMGGRALATTGFPINRERVAELLGFSGLVENSLDATGHVDYLLQATAAIAIALSSMGRMAEGIYLWNTAEFGMLEIAVQYCSISSIMPQKKNPVALEMIRGEGALAANRLNDMMSILKAVPPGGGREWGYAAKVFPPCANTAMTSIKTMAGIIATLKVNRTLMLRRAAEGFSTVTELADTIVRETGLSFRQAHHIVGQTTLSAVESGKKGNQITPGMVNQAAREVIGQPLDLSDEMVQKALDPVENVNIRNIIGGPAPGEVKRMIGSRKKGLAQARDRAAQRKHHLQLAGEELERAVNALTAN